MPISPTSSHDVVIAGGGPVGLLLASELRLAGCTVLVLERDANPDSPAKSLPFGLRGLSVATVEMFDRRDLLAAIEDRMAAGTGAASAHWQYASRRPAGHFAGIMFFHDQIDQARWPHRLPTSRTNIAADMASIEAVLAARALAAGVDIRRDCRVDSVEQSEDGVVVRAGEEAFRGGWLVGCDGARSVVRKAASIGLTGTDPEFTGYSVQVELADPAALPAGRHYTDAGMYFTSGPNTIRIADFDGGAGHDGAPVTRDRVETVLRRVSGADVAVSALDFAATWTDRAFQATEYRKGRVLLAGDAAHIHSPLGGQGLNLGFGDAMNLGWKLAATIRGDAPAGLLDSYHRERHPVGAQILDWSRAQVALMRPSASSRALKAIVRDLVDTGDGATYFAERVWGVGQRYDLGDAHPLVGRGVPDFELADGTRLGRHLRDGTGLLLDFDRRASMQAVAGRWADRVGYIGSDATDRMGLSALLVRPDGIVAWAADAPGDEAAAEAACYRWFGEPCHSA